MCCTLILLLQVLAKGRPDDGWPGMKDRQVGGDGRGRGIAACEVAVHSMGKAVRCHSGQPTSSAALIRLLAPMRVQVPLRDDQTYIPGLLNSQGTKVGKEWRMRARGTAAVAGVTAALAAADGSSKQRWERWQQQ